MGRKKKTAEEPKKEVKAQTSSNSFSYTGKISVSLRKGNKTYFTKQFKNKGRWPLFYFFNMCLRGDYKTADVYRPKYINAFGKDSWIGENEPIITDEPGVGESISSYFNSNYITTVTSYPYLALPDIDVSGKNPNPKNIGSSQITYKFDIPFSQIDSTKPINALALYAKPVRNDTGELGQVANPCAYFFVLDKNKKIADMIEEVRQQVSSISDDYNLYVEWTLSISNSEIKGE